MVTSTGEVESSAEAVWKRCGSGKKGRVAKE